MAHLLSLAYSLLANITWVKCLMNGYSLFSKIIEEESVYLAPSIGSQREGVFYKVVFKIFLIVANLCEIAD